MKTLPVLISYAYEKCFQWDKIKEYAPRLNLLIDCGAFTVHKKGKVIKMEEYYDFLYSLDFEIIDYFALDSIGDPIQTFKNFIKMKEDGFDPLPIFTRGDTLEQLEEYFKYSDIVALGGLWAGGENDPGYVKWITEEGFRGRKIHWLGFAMQNLMYHYKPYSVDTSNWKTGLRYGNIKIYDGVNLKSFSKADFKKSKIPPCADKIIQMGFDPYRMKFEEAWRGQITYAHLVNCKSYLKYVEDLKKRTGVNYYFVCNWDYEVWLLLQLQENKEQNIIDLINDKHATRRFMI